VLCAASTRLHRRLWRSYARNEPISFVGNLGRKARWFSLNWVAKNFYIS